MTQPFATIAASIIVLTGVILTLRHNAKQLIRTQLRAAATERHKSLQDEYSRFAGACFDLLANLDAIQAWTNKYTELDFRRRTSGGLAGEVPEEIDADLRAALTRTEELLQAQPRIKATAMTAQAKLYLLDDAGHRSDMVVKCLLRLFHPEIKNNLLERTNLRHDISGFMELLRDELQSRYQGELDRANLLLPPVRLVQGTVGDASSHLRS